MTRPDVEAARAVLAALRLPRDARLEAITSGHINESWRVHAPGDDVLLQWLNHDVFPDAEAIQDNVETVLDHLGGGTPQVVVPKLRHVDGARRVRCGSGLWRAFAWLPGRVVHDCPDGAAAARAAGVALGAALHALRALPTDRIRSVLARFHDLDARLADLDAARAAAGAERRAEAAALLSRVEDQREARRADAPASARPRVLHGDPKFTNFLFPTAAGAGAVALVDWDTVMVGPLAWDLGDFLRSAACRGGEDDPAAAQVDGELLRAGAGGFVAGLGESLPAEDRNTLVTAPAHMAFMLAVRFLTDHLAGDRYFRVRRPRQNLDRARAQLALVDGFDAAQGVLRRVVDGTDAEE